MIKIPNLGDITALPDWAEALLREKTPYLASDPGLYVSYIHEERCQVFTRGYLYGIDRIRQQII